MLELDDHRLTLLVIKAPMRRMPSLMALGCCYAGHDSAGAHPHEVAGQRNGWRWLCARLLNIRKMASAVALAVPVYQQATIVKLADDIDAAALSSLLQQVTQRVLQESARQQPGGIIPHLDVQRRSAVVGVRVGLQSETS